ncbi:hypothetical protein DIPPA_17597 [Diplonema papillatum]|nr:hypothetical protein DIPPA_17597 [Diplonema papillatum]
MTDPGFKELAAQVQAQGKQMADLMAAVSGLVRQAQTDGAKKQSTTNAPSWADDEGDERELCWDDGGDGVAGSDAEKAGGKAEKARRVQVRTTNQRRRGRRGEARGVGWKTGEKEKEAQRRVERGAGKKPTAARAMEEEQRRHKKARRQLRGGRPDRAEAGRLGSAGG